MTPQELDSLRRSIAAAVLPGFRQRLRTRGLARSIIWRNGQLPEGSPDFSASLSRDLLEYGFSLLRLGMRLRSASEDDAATDALRCAAEAIESVVRNGDAAASTHAFNSLIGAMSYHLARYAARAYSMIPSDVQALNLSVPERVAAHLIKRSLNTVRSLCVEYLNGPEASDNNLANALETGALEKLDALVVILNSNYCTAIAAFLHALETGRERSMQLCRSLLGQGEALASEIQHVPLWWLNHLTRNMLDDMWGQSLHVLLPRDTGPSTWNDMRAAYIRGLAERDVAQVDLWPSQTEAVGPAIDSEKNIALALPTGAGKTRIAELAILRTLSMGRRCIYVCPLRALSAQIERRLYETFSYLGKSVTTLYGAIGASAWDQTDFATADIVIATPEKFDFALRNNSALLDDVGLVVLDEGHMIGLGAREIRYEMLVQRLLRRTDAAQRRIVCLSAMLPVGEALDDFVEWLSANGNGQSLRSTWRPTRQRSGIVSLRGDAYRLDMTVESEMPFLQRFIVPQPGRGRRRVAFPKNEQELVIASAWRFLEDSHSVLIYCPLKASVESLGKCILDLLEKGYVTPQAFDAQSLNEVKRIGIEWLGGDHVVLRCLDAGVALHHGGLPRPFVAALERVIASRGVKVIISSPTLAQGVNITASTVIFYSLYRNREPIPVDEFLNVCGRAGRPYVDIDGQIIFTAHGAGRDASRRKRRWKEMIESVNQRKLQSGLVALVSSLVRKLEAAGLGTLNDITEYLLGMTLLNEGDDRRKQLSVDDDLRLLDEAILSLLGDSTNCNLDDVVGVLDDLLAGSLWSRQLARLSEARRHAFEEILNGRTRVLWGSTTPEQRRAYHLAGLDLHAGLFLESIYELVASEIEEAEELLTRFAMDEAIASVCRIIEPILNSDYFVKAENRPVAWRDITSAWLRGDALAEIIRANGGDALEFVDDNLCYTIVWAVEALRARLETERPGTTAGLVSLILETGCANVSGASLLRLGLRSRVAAISVVHHYDLRFITTRDVIAWLASGQAANAIQDVAWQTDEAREEWADFLKRTETSWLLTFATDLPIAEAEWLGEPLTVGSEVRLFREPDGVGIYSVDLRKVGRLVGNVPELFLRVTIASVGDGGVIVAF